MKYAWIACLAACSPPAFEVATHGNALRPNNPRTPDMFHYEPGDVVEHLDSAGGEFRIHYTRAGRHAVALADADMSGVPDTVERNARLYDELIAHYRLLGWRDPVSDLMNPDNGGDQRFDVYLVDFARAADGSFRSEFCTGSICSGFMVQENDFVGYGYPSVTAAERTVASHELFHAVQAAYDADQGSVLAEGTAVWAEEEFDPTLTDFEGQIDGYLDNPGRSIDVPLPGPVDRFSYGSAIFFRFLSERFDPVLIKELYEGVVDGAGGVPDPKWKDVLPGLLAMHGSSFADAFTEFASWNLYTGGFASMGYGYANAARYPRVKAIAVTAPVDEADLRIFYASQPVYSVTVDGRDPIDVAIVGDDLQGLVLLTAPIRGGRLVSPPGTSTPRASISGAEGLLVTIVNTNLAGNSKRPSLCAGTATEVDACLMRHAPPTPDAGLNAPDAEPAPDAATFPDAGVTADDASVPVAELPTSCASTPASSPLALLIVLVLLHKRRR